MSFIHSTQFTELVGNRNVSQFRLRNLFDPEFQLNAQDLVCSMPCNTACDRDSAIIVPIKNVQRVSSGASI
jgi:hypothetical protein